MIFDFCQSGVKEGSNLKDDGGFVFSKIGKAGEFGDIDLQVKLKDVDGSSKGLASYLEGSFGIVMVPMGSEVTLTFKVVIAGTGVPVPPDQLFLAFFDIDREGGRSETVTVGGFAEYLVSKKTDLGISSDGGKTTFSGKGLSDSDPPTHSNRLTDEQKKRTVTFKFEKKSEFDVTLRVSKGSSGPRKFMFGGSSSLLPNHCAPSISPTCGATTTTTTTIACSAVCDNGESNGGVELEFSSSPLLLNNLGGKGPGNGPEAMIFENIGMAGEHALALQITASSAYDACPSSSPNGRQGPYGIIGLKTGSSVDLIFDVVKNSGHKAIAVPQFYFSFVNIDENVLDTSIESVGVDDYDEYVVDSASELSIQQGSDGKTWFTATAFGKQGSSPPHPYQLTDEQKKHAVTLSFKDVSRFKVTFKVKKGLGSSSDCRHFLFAGSSNLVNGCRGECAPTVPPTLPPTTTPTTTPKPTPPAERRRRAARRRTERRRRRRDPKPVVTTTTLPQTAPITERRRRRVERRRRRRGPKATPAPAGPTPKPTPRPSGRRRSLRRRRRRGGR